MIVLSADKLRKLGEKYLTAAGAMKEEAELVSDFLVRANLAGHDSHGIIRILRYTNNLLEKRIKPGSRLEVVRETPSSILLNGNWGFGQVVGSKAMRIAIEKAERNTIGVASVFNCNHVGRLADYTLMAAEKNMIGLAFVNASKMVAPFGGMERMLGTNPISFAAPSAEGRPFVFDMATSVCAEGKVWVRLQSKQQLPEGWILDKEGKPSINPSDLYSGGAIQPFGGYAGYKGYGLSLVTEILAGIMSGTGCEYSSEFKGGNGVFFEAINIGSFIDITKFRKQMKAVVKAIRNSKKAPGSNDILVPGDPEERMEKKRLAEGIPLAETTWTEFKTLADKLQIDMQEIT
jgi:LDH2 family malate/lactate/ureidoglycolate dehydrogenase